MHLARTVDRQPHEEAGSRRRSAPHSSSSRVPFVWIVYAMRWCGSFNRSASSTERRKKSSSHHRRLATLPRDGDLGRTGVRLDQLAQVGLEELVGHAEPAARVQHLLGQEEAVRAVEVADSARRLGEEMEGSGRIARKRCSGRTPTGVAHHTLISSADRPTPRRCHAPRQADTSTRRASPREPCWRFRRLSASPGSDDAARSAVSLARWSSRWV